MSESQKCERCGGPLPEGAMGGQCPRCLLEVGLEQTSGSSEDSGLTRMDGVETLAPGGGALAGPRMPAAIGRYKILRLIGEGGMGAVYEAEQEQPRRTVALKVIKPGLASPQLLFRFEQEAQALGRLQHPGIAQIYEAGTADAGFGPQPYFAMEFIRGATLREYVDQHRLSTRDRLEMIAKVSEAVHHAHQRGLIHRDLKPGNILVDETGQPKILDFGVARVTDSDTQATMQTDVGQLVGTLAYMSPEQVLADPLELDTRSDVYALGVIFYELLAGRLPYDISRKLHEAIHAIREEDPAKLSAINRSYRGDIETIVAKALEKDKTRRYASAAELSADITRYLKDEAIVARPPTATYQLKKFTRRHKAIVGGIAAVFVVLVAGVVASTTQWMRARSAESAAIEDKNRAVEAERKTGLERDGANAARAGETKQRQAAEAARVQADDQKLVAQQALSESQANLYFNNIDLANRERVASNIGHADQLLDEAPALLRNWEWHYLSRLNHMEDATLAGHRDAIRALAFEADGKRLRTASIDNTIKDWNIGTWNETATVTFGAAASREIGAMALSANGRMLYSRVGSNAIGNSSVIHNFWDLLTGKEVFSANIASFGLTYNAAIGLSPDGRRLVAGLYGRRGDFFYTLRSWDIGTGRELSVLGEYESEITDLTFSPDGTRLAVGQQLASTSILDATTGQKLVTLDRSQRTSTLAFSRDGETVAAGIPSGVRAWKTADGQERWSTSSGTGIHVAFSPDARLLAVARADRTIRILDGATGREDVRLTGHTETINALGFTPDGTHLVSAGDDKIVRVWNMRVPAPSLVFDVGRTGPLVSVRVSPDGHTLLISTASGVKSWDSNTGQIWVTERPSQGVTISSRLRGALEFNADGTRIALLNTTIAPTGVGFRSDLQVLDARNGRQIAMLHQPRTGESGTSIPSDFRISPAGDRAALVFNLLRTQQGGAGLRIADSEAHIWDLATGRLITSFALDKTPVQSLQFSPDGKLAAVHSLSSTAEGPNLRIYDTTTGRRLRRLAGPELAASPFLFSPGGNRLAGVTSGRAVTIWDTWTGAELVSLSLPEAINTVTSIAFSPDGTRLVSVSSVGDVQLWDAASGKPLISLRESSGPYSVREVTVIDELGAQAAARSGNSAAKVFTISFSPDGRKITLTTVAPDPKGTSVRIETWDASPRRK